VPIGQVVPLVRRALKILSDREVSPQLGLLKSTLLQLDSTFSERTYGVSSFRDFADKLAAAGHVTVREMGRNVVVELTESGAKAPAGDEQAESPGAAAPAAAQPAHRGHGRREDQAAPVQEPRVADAVREVRRLFQSAQQPPRWPMYVRQAKQFMRNVDSTFDERKFGFNSIVDLLRACQRESLFRIERDRQGVMRLFQGNVMQAAGDGGFPVEQAGAPRAPRPWQPGDDIPDIHEADRPEPVAVTAERSESADVVDGDVVPEVETPEVLDAQTTSEESPAAEQREPKKGRGGRGRSTREPKAAKAAKAPRTKKTAAPRQPRQPRARKAASE